MIHHPLTLVEFQQIVCDNKDKLIVIDFCAKWCGPCNNIAKRVAELEPTFGASNVSVIKCDIDESPEVSDEFKIQSLPTFVFIKNGAFQNSVIGADIDGVESMIKSLV
jgi:thioredoxin 1